MSQPLQGAGDSGRRETSLFSQSTWSGPWTAAADCSGMQIPPYLNPPHRWQRPTWRGERGPGGAGPSPEPLWLLLPLWLLREVAQELISFQIAAL